MKKILLLMGLFVASMSIDAQTNVSPANTNYSNHIENINFDLNKLKARQQTTDRAPGTFWLNYASTMDQYNGGGVGSVGPAELNGNYLFPDSTVQGEFGAGNFAAVWVHHLGDILDVKSDFFDIIDGCNWGVADPYQVDSVAIVYSYTRNTTETDTLVVTLLNNQVAANIYSGYFTGATATNYGTDTLSIKTLNYSITQNLATGSGRKTFKIPLGAADATASGDYIEKSFAVPAGFNVPAGKLLGCDIMFKPGYSWISEDHVDDLNAFFFASYEENGGGGAGGSYQTYVDCNLNSVNCDYNSSSIVPQDVRYATAGGWNGKFIPSYAYTIGYAFEHHLISYHVTNPIPLGITEVAGNNDFALNQNQPNPFANQTTINYQLKKDAENVSVLIFDVTGVKLFEKTGLNVKAGSYSVDVNTTDYAAGLYFYSIIVDGTKVTKKMIAE